MYFKKEFIKTKEYAKICRDKIKEFTDEKMESNAFIDRLYRMYVMNTGEGKVWLQCFINTVKAERKKKEAELRRWEIRLDINTGKIKGDIGLKIADAKAVPLGRILREGSGRGNKRVYRCPIHNEKTPSFYWYVKQNQGHCFGCGWHGDAIDLMQELEQCTFKEAINSLLKC